MARMLGRYGSGECGCADCSPPRGRHSARLSSRWRKRIEAREVEREYRLVLIEREERPAALFDEHDLAAIAMFDDDEAGEQGYG